ncbi:MAG: trehalase family glycosidase [Alphaproteobacteria bacterium]
MLTLKGKPTADQLTDQAMDVLQKNDRGGYCVPTAGLYPFQWNWDSALTSLGWARFNRTRALQELDALFSGQWPDGMIPHILFHQNDPGYFPGPDQWGCGAAVPSSGITQPPVIGFALSQLGRDLAEKTELATRYAEKLHRWHRWWADARDPEETGLVAILHPWESGRDNSAEWDSPLEAVTPLDTDLTDQRRDLDHVDADQRPSGLEYRRYMALVRLFRDRGYQPDKLWSDTPFRVADIGINALLIHDMRCLADLLEQTGLYPEIRRWTSDRIEQMTDAFRHLHSNETGLHHSRDTLTGELLPYPVNACWLALLADLPAVQVDHLLTRAEEIVTHARFSMPSLDPAHDSYEHQRYWRGPVWAIVNRLLSVAFARHGTRGEKLAARLRQDTAEMIQDGGFAEYFCPETGAALGGQNFTWTAAMWLDWKLDLVVE